MSGDSIARPEHASAPRDPRPREVRLVSILLMFFGGLGLVLAPFLLRALRDDAAHGRSVSGPAYGLVAVATVLALTQLLCGVFVFQGREWARKVAIGVCALSVVTSLVALAAGAVYPVVIGVAISIVIFANINKPPVVSWMR